MTQLAQSLALMRRAREQTDRVLVALSGGKDSLATLSLAVEVFGAANVVAFAMYLVKGLRCFEVPIDAAARRHGVRVEYVPHWVLGRLYKYATLMPHRGNAAQWRETKLTDIEQLVRKRTGIEWIAYGHRAGESIQRRGMLNRCQGFNESARRVYPVWHWRVADILGYLRVRRIPIPHSFGKFRQSGVDLEPSTLAFIKEHFPGDFAKILKVFPFAEAQLKRREFFPETAPKPRGHGKVQTGAYQSWRTMIQRCTNPRHKHYANYGGRGVTVCARWREDFEAFLADVGERPAGLTLDRIDPGKGYEPGNVRWATRKEQQRNRSVNRMVELDGETRCVAEWAEKFGIDARVVISRLNGGWEPRRALSTPVER